MVCIRQALRAIEKERGESWTAMGVTVLCGGCWAAEWCYTCGRMTAPTCTRCGAGVEDDKHKILGGHSKCNHAREGMGADHPVLDLESQGQLENDGVWCNRALLTMGATKTTPAKEVGERRTAGSREELRRSTSWAARKLTGS